eukprot:5324492-Amphidinium_carterae.1
MGLSFQRRPTVPPHKPLQEQVPFALLLGSCRWGWEFLRRQLSMCQQRSSWVGAGTSMHRRFMTLFCPCASKVSKHESKRYACAFHVRSC